MNTHRIKPVDSHPQKGVEGWAKPLSHTELETLRQCETVITRHLEAFFEVGRALMKIQRDKLYRTEYRSFDDYCRARWNMGRFYAYRQIQAARVVENLLTECQHDLPSTEAQARELVGLPPEQAAQAWRGALLQTKNGRVSAKDVAEARKRLTTAQPVNPDLEETWRKTAIALTRGLKRALQSGSRAEAQVIVGRLELILSVGTYGAGNAPEE